MNQNHKITSGISRRDFLKGAAAGAVGLAAAGLLTGCESQETPTSTPCPEPTAASGQFAWETAPEPIPEDQIKETVESDIVVVGGGFSGLCCALSGREAGAEVVLIERMRQVIGRGGSIFAINSKLTKEKGYELSEEEISKIYKRMMGYHSYRIDGSK